MLSYREENHVNSEIATDAVDVKVGGWMEVVRENTPRAPVRMLPPVAPPVLGGVVSKSQILCRECSPPRK
jgi:hypothetical protein